MGGTRVPEGLYDPDSRAAVVPVQVAGGGESTETTESKRGSKASGPGGCYTCGRQGHWKAVSLLGWVTETSPREGEDKRAPPVKRTGRGWVYWACGQQGHLQKECLDLSGGVETGPGEGAKQAKDHGRPLAKGRQRVGCQCHEEGHIRRYYPAQEKAG